MAMLLPSSGLFGRTSASLGIESFKGRYSALREAATSNRWLISDAAKSFNDTKDLGCVVVVVVVVVEKVVVEEEKVAAVVEKGPNIEARPRAVLSKAIILEFSKGLEGAVAFFQRQPGQAAHTEPEPF